MIISKPQEQGRLLALDHDLCGAIEGLVSALEFARETPIPMDSLKEQVSDLAKWISDIGEQIDALEEES